MEFSFERCRICLEYKDCIVIPNEQNCDTPPDDCYVMNGPESAYLCLDCAQKAIDERKN